MSMYPKHTLQSSEIGQDLRGSDDGAQIDNYTASNSRTEDVAQALSERGYDVETLRYCVIVRGSTSLRASDDALLNRLSIFWESRPEADECILIPKESYREYREVVDA